MVIEIGMGKAYVPNEESNACLSSIKHLGNIETLKAYPYIYY